MKRTKQELQKLINELVRLKDAERVQAKKIADQVEVNNAKTGSQEMYVPKTG